MKTFLTVVAIGAMASTFAPVYSQTPPASPSSSPPAAAEQAAPTAAASKRTACQTSNQLLKGQDKRDQIQLCMAQARLDCLKEAIDKKVVGSQRRDFVKSCVGGGGEEPM
jgi:hypothetical protein